MSQNELSERDAESPAETDTARSGSDTSSQPAPAPSEPAAPIPRPSSEAPSPQAPEQPDLATGRPAPGAESDQGPPAAKKRRRRKKRNEALPAPPAAKPAAPKRTPVEALEKGLSLLAEAYLGIRQRSGGGRLEDAQTAEEVELRLRVPLKRGNERPAAEKLHQALRDDLEQRVLKAGLLVPGRAWCFSSESYDSDYSRPADPRQVLVGYGLEGRPRYADLVTLAIERKHEAVDDLLAGKQGAVSFVETGAEVTDGVRPAFDPDTVPYRLIAQTISGLFESTEEGRRVALTIQVLAHDGPDGKLHLILHPVSAVDLMDLPDPGIRKILRNFQHKLTQIAKEIDGKRAAGEEIDVAEAVLSPLRELARRLSQDAKNRERKTGHARERSAQGQRPTQLAFPEALSARDHHIHIDNEEQTFVVVGKKGRIHVFSPDGRHVTTVVMPPASLRQRVKSGRWRLAEPAERGSFREAIAGRAGEETAGPPGGEA